MTLKDAVNHRRLRPSPRAYSGSGIVGPATAYIPPQEGDSHEALPTPPVEAVELLWPRVRKRPRGLTRRPYSGNKSRNRK